MTSCDKIYVNVVSAISEELWIRTTCRNGQHDHNITPNMLGWGKIIGVTREWQCHQINPSGLIFSFVKFYYL